MTPAEIEQAVSRTGAQYLGDLRTMLAEVGKIYEGQLAAKDAVLAAKDQALAADALTIAELRRRAEVAEAERDRLAAAQAAPEPPHATEVETPAVSGVEASAGFLARLRRFFGGE